MCRNNACGMSCQREVFGGRFSLIFRADPFPFQKIAVILHSKDKDSLACNLKTKHKERSV